MGDIVSMEHFQLGLLGREYIVYTAYIACCVGLPEKSSPMSPISPLPAKHIFFEVNAMKKVAQDVNALFMSLETLKSLTWGTEEWKTVADAADKLRRELEVRWMEEIVASWPLISEKKQALGESVAAFMKREFQDSNVARWRSLILENNAAVWIENLEFWGRCLTETVYYPVWLSHCLPDCVNELDGARWDGGDWFLENEPFTGEYGRRSVQRMIRAAAASRRAFNRFRTRKESEA